MVSSIVIFNRTSVPSPNSEKSTSLQPPFMFSYYSVEETMFEFDTTVRTKHKKKVLLEPIRKNGKILNILLKSFKITRCALLFCPILAGCSSPINSRKSPRRLYSFPCKFLGILLIKSKWNSWQRRMNDLAENRQKMNRQQAKSQSNCFIDVLQGAKCLLTLTS